MVADVMNCQQTLAFTLAARAAHAGGYVGASAGYTDFPNEFDGAASFAANGGYQINDKFAVEAAYLYLGEAEDDVAPIWEAEVTGFNFSAVGILPVSKKVDLFGKIGIFMWDVEVSEKGYGKLGSEDGSDLSLGLGGAFHVMQEFSVIAEVQRFEVEDESLTNFSVGARLNF
jgi:hypothetical protein